MKTMFVRFICTIILICAAGFTFAGGTVNINTADAQTLAAELKGVGDKKALAIVKHREKNGLFKSKEDLAAVKGISDKIVEKNADRITIENQ